MKQRIKWIATALCAALLMPGMTQVSAAESADLRVGTFNIAANKIASEASQGVGALAKIVDENKIDVVGLQEVDVGTSRNPGNLLEEFVEAGDMKYSSFQKAIDVLDGEYGIGIASRLPLTDTDGTQMARGNLELEEDRAFQKAVVEVNGKKVAIYNTHLSWEADVPTAIAARKLQMEEIKKNVLADKTEYKVIVGDFNADQDHSEWYTFLESLNLANGGSGKWYVTFNGVDPDMVVYEIDNIITTRNIAVSNITMVDTSVTNDKGQFISDHNLFYADLKLLDKNVPSRQYLNVLAEEAGKLNKPMYSAASYAAVTDALKAAQAVPKNATQKQIDKAAQSLRSAMDALVKISMTANAL